MVVVNFIFVPLFLLLAIKEGYEGNETWMWVNIGGFILNCLAVILWAINHA